MERIKSIDALNGIGILLVVMGHYDFQLASPAWSVWIYSFHMPLFFITGGALFQIKAESYHKEGVFKYIVKNIRHLLLPYSVFFVLSVVVKNFLGTTDVSDVVYILKAWVLGGGHLMHENINNFALWFFQLYFLARMIMYIMYRIYRKYRIFFYILLGIICVGTIPFQRMIQGRPAFHINVLPAAIVFMWIGYFSWKYRDKVLGRLHEPFTTVAVISLLYGGICIAYMFPGNIASINHYLYFIGALATTAVFYLAQSEHPATILVFWGENSSFILGVHAWVLALFRKYVQNILFTQWSGVMVYFIMCGLMMIVLSLGIIVWRSLWKRVKNTWDFGRNERRSK